MEIGSICVTVTSPLASPRLHEVALVHATNADATPYGRRDRCVREPHFFRGDGRIARLDAGPQLFDERGLLLDALAGDDVLILEIAVAGEVYLGHLELRLFARSFGLGLRESGGDGAVVDAREHGAPLDDLTFRE